jgi:hypothetical protein
MKKKDHNKKNLNSAIIGYTGYIGSFLKKQKKDIKHLYNSKNINKLNNNFFDTVYLTAPSSLKYHANKFPQKDKRNVLKLIKNLKNFKCNKIIYFSSTDIIDARRNKKNYYGLNRLKIENFIKKRFKNYLIIRLPSLFGGKLRKNFFYDILNNKLLKFYNSRTELQWYYLENIFKDISFLSKKKTKTVNLVSEPISCKEIANFLKIENLTFNNNLPIYKYNIKDNNRYNKSKYFYTKEEILKKMKINYKKSQISN